MSATHEDAVGKAALAKAALRYLAERRMVPTPENFEGAWRTVGGDSNGAPRGIAPKPALDEAVMQFVEGVIGQMSELRLLTADRATEARGMVRGARWKEASGLISIAVGERKAMSWSVLFSALVHGLMVQHRGWTQARKRDSVTRVIEGANRRDEMLYPRLQSLLDSWSREPLDETPEAVPVLPATPVTLPLSAPAQGADAGLVVGLNAGAGGSASAGAPVSSGANAAAGPVLLLNTPEQLRQQRNERMIAEMSELLATLCESMAGVSEETSWIRGQTDALRQSLEHPDDYRALGEIRRLIAQAGEAQRKITASRRSSIDEVKLMISAWIDSVGELSNSADEFGTRIGGYAEKIEGLDSVESLSSTVSEMLADTRTMVDTIQQSRDEMAATRSRAMMLESSVSRLEDELANASTQVITDHLTNTMNRRGLEQAFAGAQSRAREWRSKLTLAVLDVDDFKRVNDSLGHKGGDDALRQLARVFKMKLRSTDAVARFGGEEFVLLLPDLEVPEAVEHLTKLQREVTAHVFMSDEKRMFITFSAGVTEVSVDDALMSAVERADQAMYSAKRAGKNCVRAV